MMLSLCCLLLSLLFPQFETFTLTCDRYIDSEIGKTVILKCSFESRSNSNPVVIWEKVGEKQTIHEYRDNRDDFSEQHKNYTKRTAIAGNAVNRGDASLTLKDVNVWDEGTYKCYVSTNHGFDDEIIELSVWAKGTGDIHISWQTDGDNNDVLTCKYSGLYPVPKISWKDTHGNDLNSINKTNPSRDENGLYHVEHYLKRERDDKNQYVCSVHHKWMAKPKAARAVFTNGHNMIQLDDGEPSPDL
ncbi:V-set domain-containing T-cell activation inhibitor 1-like [Chiloscyllium punctatum]